MSDPYKVLGISPHASDDEVKQAYRALAKKYHPDRYGESGLASQAAEKMKEINEAYDRIMKQRKEGIPYIPEDTYSCPYNNYSNNTAYTNNNYGGSQSYQSSSSSRDYTAIYRMINEGRLSEAEQILNGYSPTERDAEWYYLMGTISYSKGWLEEAFNYASTACHMAPHVDKYRALYERIVQQRSGTQGGYVTTRGGAADCCDCISCLICTDCLCNCGRCS